MIPSSRLAASLLCSLLTAVLLAACGGGDHPREALISAARASPDGTQVRVEGLVTVPSGRFNSSTFDEGFAIQDESGGIYVTTQALNGLQLGDWVRFDAERVTGIESLQIELKPLGAIEVKARQYAQVRPLDLETVAINRDTGGELVRVSGLVVQAAAVDEFDGYTFGYIAFINDGSGPAKIFINIDSLGLPLINVALLQVGAVVEVTGFVYNYESDFEVSPRQASDLVVLSSPPPPP